MAGRRNLNGEAHRADYDRAYTMWRWVLEDAYRSEGLDEACRLLRSDTARGQDEWLVLSMDDEPIGLVMLSWLDLRARADRDCAFLDTLPAAVNALVRRDHHDLMVYRHLVVVPAQRRTAGGFGAADMLVDLAVLRFLESTASLLVGYTRNRRSAHHLFLRHGGRTLATIESHGSESDIVAIGRAEAKLTAGGDSHDSSKTLWGRRITTSSTLEPTPPRGDSLDGAANPNRTAHHA